MIVRLVHLRRLRVEHRPLGVRLARDPGQGDPVVVARGMPAEAHQSLLADDAERPRFVGGANRRSLGPRGPRSILRGSGRRGSSRRDGRVEDVRDAVVRGRRREDRAHGEDGGAQRARDSRGTSGAKHTTTRRSRPFSLRSSPHWRIISTNSRRLWSLCQSNLRRDLACFSRRHRRRMAKRAPPGAKSRQCRAGSLTIARGAGECAPSVSSWPCISSITSFATSWRSMGGAAGNALDSRTVMPSSLRRYASLCAGEGEGEGRRRRRRGALGLLAGARDRALREARRGNSGAPRSPSGGA